MVFLAAWTVKDTTRRAVGLQRGRMVGCAKPPTTLQDTRHRPILRRYLRTPAPRDGFTMTFRDGPIEGVIWKPLTFFRDPRGWLCELFRHDEVPEEFHPVMAYMSMTEPGIARGPHEQVEQADYFCFI